MGILNSQKIAAYYERFKAIDVTFTKEMIQTAGLIPQQVLLKCGGDFWPCVVYSSSFEGAKIVANIKSGIIEKLQAANNTASLRFGFKSPENGAPVAFFVTVRSMSCSPYSGSQEMGMFTLQFTQRPPDDLIEIMGRILDANMNSSKRRDERIILTPDALRRLKILSKESVVFIQDVPRNCMLRDISFSGAKLVLMGVPKFLLDKQGALRMEFDDPHENFLIRGKISRAEAVEGRKDLVAAAMIYDEPHVPIGYKMRINDYLGQTKVEGRAQEKAKRDAGTESPAS
jgi:hypothetical protein